MSIRSLCDRSLITRMAADEILDGGIIIPDTAKEKPQEGEVVAVGNGRILDDGSVQPLDVKPKDKVLFSKYGGTEITLDGAEYLILREEDILGVVE